MPLLWRARPQAKTDPRLVALQAASSANATQPVPPSLRLLAVSTLIVFGVSLLPGWVGAVMSYLRWVLLLVLVGWAATYVVIQLRRGLLWRLRNKLVLTYLLIGLAPVALFFTLVFLSSYVAFGQFAVHLVSSRLEMQAATLQQSNMALARHAAAMLNLRQTNNANGELSLPGFQDAMRGAQGAGLQLALYEDGHPVPVAGITGHARSPLWLSDWVAHRAAHGLDGFVEDGAVMYLAAADSIQTADGHTLTVISSQPLDDARLASASAGIGRMYLLPGLVPRPAHHMSRAEEEHARIAGGTAPPAANLLDFRVRFLSSLSAADWESGEMLAVPMNVESRPSVLYNELFSEALTGRNTDLVRIAFLIVCLLFAALEAFALYVGLRLSRSITGAVEDLYEATVAIDRGELQHRIAVNQDDQLADLARSFNRMSWSLGRLIEQQKEKERMESELSIAQEVQANLFPLLRTAPIRELELHGICRPARTVSGDYYDFLTFDRKVGENGSAQREVTGLGVALGDISGKGISAALLMATLHSAVRAYRFASEELQAPSARLATHGGSEECSELFVAPGRVLALLNKHLYRSTTPEKYATLFLAHYDRASARLTYSNAGQLPPFVLRTDGSLHRLDRGGTVVGLMDNMSYDEGSLQMEPGDILIAYSDGVTEPENDFGEFGEDRLIDVVRQFRDEPLDVISGEVMRALDAWIGEGEQPDDITLVLARQQA
ncbi:PP2C family protein-serine/threonine phosphatase [Terriglobus aquaticus]|uniref:PP2C family protein-serine/threonine phosphatase n=1 Tax=Terriglobus aquaticus TaxID=940139 RepID=A0ABW9KJS5_9BACT|nr:PP2C family protein-serine/threonine phosphatase [Terriglobus aquaticus]